MGILFTLGVIIIVMRVDSLPYVEATILELLRYTAVVPLPTARCTLKDTEVGGYFIPEGTTVSWYSDAFMAYRLYAWIVVTYISECRHFLWIYSAIILGHFPFSPIYDTADIFPFWYLHSVFILTIVMQTPVPGTTGHTFRRSKFPNNINYL